MFDYNMGNAEKVKFDRSDAVSIRTAPLLLSQRFVLSVLSFIGLLMVYVTRVNLSVAILCMVGSNPSNANSESASVALNTTITSRGSNCGEDTYIGTDTGYNVTQVQSGEFDWDRRTTSELLTMYYYGYIVTQIPSGWLASRYGGKRIWGWNMLVCAVCTLATPLCARTHVYLLYCARVVLGLAAGFTFPCLHALLGRWSPPLERTIITAFVFSGVSLGNILTFSISGVLCQHGFDNGWGSIFYLSGMFNLVWVIAWFLVTADTHGQHRWITEREKVYIETSIGRGDVKKVRSVPWRKMFTSGPLWAVITGHFCSNYMGYTLISSLPTFMKESLNFDIKQNGLLSALPYVGQLAVTVFVGHGADIIRQKGWMSTKNVRKSFQVFSFLGISLFISIVGQMTCEQRHLAVVFLCLCAVVHSVSRAGYVVNHLDLAPSYAGILFGITNTAGTVPGMIAPVIAGALTPNRTAEEWKVVFYVCAAVEAFGAIAYFFLADGELQDWAVPPEVKIKMDIVAEHYYGDSKTQIDKAPEQIEQNGRQVQDTQEIVSTVEIYRF